MSIAITDEIKAVLSGKVFVATRPKGKSYGMQTLCKEVGATLLELPTIEVSALPLKSSETDTIKNISKFDWIVFTSANGARFFMQQIKSLGLSLQGVKIAVIGSKTGEILQAFGMQIDFIGNSCTGESFVKELEQVFSPNNPHVLWPTGNLAPTFRTEELQAIADVTRIDVYQTSPVEQLNKNIVETIKMGAYDLLLLYSPSAFHNFLEGTKGELSVSDLKVGCIGPTTQKACELKGLKPLVVAKQASDKGLFDATVAYYLNQKKN